ncbi:MAG: hypothetical protein WB689_01575 [Xanthobacteraceae bacterium]
MRQEDGIWFLDINDEGTKRVKNEQSKRRVPLHAELLQLGFLDYVEKTAPKVEDRLFPQLRPGGPDNKLGFYFTKWWSQYRKDVGVYEKGLDYHSFRASVAPSWRQPVFHWKSGTSCSDTKGSPPMNAITRRVFR